MNRESLENAAIKEAIDVYQIEFHLYQNDFANEVPLTTVRCSSIVQSTPIYPYREMKVLITENKDKTSRIVNGQEATAVSCHRNTLLIQFPDQQRPFVYPVTHHGEGQGEVTTYPLTPAYGSQTSLWENNQRILEVINDAHILSLGCLA